MGEAILAVDSEWHSLAMALSGALSERGAANVEEFVVEAFLATGSDGRLDDRRGAARSTVAAYAAGQKVVGGDLLRRRWPRVADELEALLCEERESGIRLRAAPEVEVDLDAAIRDAPAGATVIAAECGSGKTRAAVRVAVERAKRPGRIDRKTSLSVDSHALARQVARDIEALGVPVQRLFGPLSGEGGACAMAEVAGPLVAGGQSVQWELCEGRGRRPARCAHYDGCGAREGGVGPSDAAVTVGVHSLLGALDGAAGATGLLVIDEPPPLLETTVLTEAMIDHARRWLDDFEPGYAARLRGLVIGCLRWIRGGDPVPPAGLEVKWPPMSWTTRCRAISSGEAARGIGEASRVLDVLGRATALSLGMGAVVASSPCAPLIAALSREGRVIVTDAGARVHLPLYERALGGSPHFVEVSMADAAPVERVLLRQRATRRRFLSAGGITPEGRSAALRAAAWATSRAGAVPWAFVSWKALVGAMAAELEAMGARLGWYGAMRGRNDWHDLDVLVSVGDPRISGYAVDVEATFGGDDAAARTVALARSELEQVHGRLRAARRERPAHCAHLGEVWPGGWGWTPERVVVMDDVG